MDPASMTTTRRTPRASATTREGSQQQSAVGRIRRGRVVRAEGRGVSETLSLSFAAATGVASRDARARPVEARC